VAGYHRNGGGVSPKSANGLMFSLLGSDKPIIESLNPALLDQHAVFENQFDGMSDIPFTYSHFEELRKDLIVKVNRMLSDEDKEFLISFELGEPEWNKCCVGNLSNFPSVQWKLQNIRILKKTNPEKHKYGIEKLSSYLLQAKDL